MKGPRGLSVVDSAKPRAGKGAVHTVRKVD